MVAAVKYDLARKDIAEKKHDFANDTFALCLTNRAPVVATDHFLSDISELATGFGYVQGGLVLTRSSTSNAGGLYKAIFDDPPVWTAAGGVLGPARYVVLVNQSTGGSPLAPGAILLLGYYDYGVGGFSLLAGEMFRADLDQVNGLLQQV